MAMLYKTYSGFALFFLFFHSSVQAGMHLELNAHLGMQSTQPTLCKFGLGIAPELAIGPISILTYLDYDRYSIQYTDTRQDYNELNYGAGAKLRLSSDKKFLMARVGRSSISYSDLKDTDWRFGGGVGATFGHTEYSLGYYRYLDYTRDVLFLSVAYVW